METGVVGAALLPHPPILFEEVGGEESRKVDATRESVKRVATWIDDLGADVLIVVSPHGPATMGRVTAMGGDRFDGDLRRFGAPEVRIEMDLHPGLLAGVTAAAGEVGISLDVDRAYANRPDHGLVVPLAALRDEGIDRPVVALGYPALDREDLQRLGRALNAACADTGVQAVVIASGDLSHRLKPEAPAGFHPEAARFDRRLIQAFRSGDHDSLRGIPDDLLDVAGECGYRPLLLALSAVEGGDPDIVSILRSYECPFGVGYGVATMTPRKSMRVFDPAELAREALRQFVCRGEKMAAPRGLSGVLASPAGCFVSLYEAGGLRGCIGTIEPDRSSLAEEVIKNTVSASSRDPRFSAITPGELGDVVVTVDVLQPPVRADFEDLDPVSFGVVVSKGSRRGVLLPGVAGVNTAGEQVRIACEKAGLSPGDPDLQIHRFEVKKYGPC